MDSLFKHITESDEKSISVDVKIIDVEPESSHISVLAIQVLNIWVQWATQNGVNISDISMMKSIQEKAISKCFCQKDAN